jgi:3-phenylpropionate/trans-cinnamate dioxygenase ferredoxin subunit
MTTLIERRVLRQTTKSVRSSDVRLRHQLATQVPALGVRIDMGESVPIARTCHHRGGVRMATEFVTAVRTSEIPVGGITAIDVRGMRVAVANVAGTYYAFDDACTHEQCSLAEEGDLAGTIVTCTCHGSEFDVRTGRVLAPPATLPVKVYPVRVAGDALEIEV